MSTRTVLTVLKAAEYVGIAMVATAALALGLTPFGVAFAAAALIMTAVSSKESK